MMREMMRATNVWKLQDDEFDGYVSAFLADWKVNVEGKDLFPIDLIDDTLQNTSL